MTPEQITDLMAQIVRVGFVNARQPEKMRVKVTLKDTPTSELVTDWLPVLCPRACKDMQYDLPDEGDQVLCLFLPYGREQGFVVGAMYGKQTPPVQSGDKWHRRFSDGAVLEYDRQSHSLKADIPGAASIKCEQPITLEAPIVYVRGTLVNTAKDGAPGKSVFSGGMEVRDGGINVPAGDVAASGVSLASHTTEGVEAGSGTSSHPTGGSASSPGTGTQPVPDLGTPAYGAWLFTNLLNLRAKMDDPTQESPSALDEIIYCLPAIAENMASKCSQQRNKQGWLYLAEMFRRWLAGSVNEDPKKGGAPFEVDWKWLHEFERINKRIEEISTPTYLFTVKSRELLIKRLLDNQKLSSQKCEFDFIHPESKLIGGEATPAWLQWPETYFQSIGVERQWWPDIAEGATWADGAQAAMASFMIYALAKGYTEPNLKGGHTIVIREVALVAYDSFNFKNWDFYFFWNCENKSFSLNPASYLEGYHSLTNSDFDAFRTKYSSGSDFLVISGPHAVDIGGEYVYDK